MITVDAIARAIVAALGIGILESMLFAMLVAGIARITHASATTRHVLWWIVLGAAVVLPVATGLNSLRRIDHRPAEIPAVASDSAPVHLHRGLTLRILTDRANAAPPVPEHASRALALVPIRAAFEATGVGTALVAVWLAVALLRVALLGNGLVALLRIKRAALPLDDAIARRLRRYRHTIRVRRTAALLVSDEIDVPIAAGFGMPAILLPRAVVERETAADLDQIVMHEHAHLDRYDDVTNFVQCLLERIFWCNPVVAFAGRRIALEREIACDDTVVAHTGRAHRYATCLWKLVQSTRLPARPVVAPGALGGPRQITKRIEQLLDSKRNALPRLSPVTAFVLGAVVTAAIFVQAQHAPSISIADASPVPSASAAPVMAAVPPPAPRAPSAPSAPSTPPPLDRQGRAQIDNDLAAAREAMRARALDQQDLAHIQAQVRSAMSQARDQLHEALRQSERERERALREQVRTEASVHASDLASLGAEIGKNVAESVGAGVSAAMSAGDTMRDFAGDSDLQDLSHQGLHRALGSFHAIRSEGSSDIVVRRGATAGIDFGGDANLARHTVTSVSNGTLIIDQVGSLDGHVNPIVVTVPALDSVALEGSANVDVAGVGAHHLAINIEGSGDVRASGTADDVTVHVEGSGNADLMGLRTSAADVYDEGSGDVKLTAPDTLHAHLEGSGDLTLRGTPKHISSTIEGSGQIVQE